MHKRLRIVISNKMHVSNFGDFYTPHTHTHKYSNVQLHVVHCNLCIAWAPTVLLPRTSYRISLRGGLLKFPQLNGHRASAATHPRVIKFNQSDQLYLALNFLPEHALGGGGGVTSRLDDKCGIFKLPVRTSFSAIRSGTVVMNMRIKTKITTWVMAEL